MQRDFETTLNEFLKKSKAYFDDLNTSLQEYEQFFHQVQQIFPVYSDFVSHVTQALETSPSRPVLKAEKIHPKVMGGTKKVLIVDDAEINRILLGHFFKNTSVNLEFSSSGEQALEKVSKISFDLIIMDLQMRGMGGIEAIQKIRAFQPENRTQTRIIAISNLESSESERDEVMKAGADYYLTKTLSREAMRERFYEILFGSDLISA